MARSLAEHLGDIGAGIGEPQRPQRPNADTAAPMAQGRSELAATARHYLRCRWQREAVFSGDLFADPAWDILLDLFASAIEGKQVTVSDACIAAHVPTSTALRWASRLESDGLVTRHRDPADGRRTYLELTPAADKRIAHWLRSTFSFRGS